MPSPTPREEVERNTSYFSHSNVPTGQIGVVLNVTHFSMEIKRPLVAWVRRETLYLINLTFQILKIGK